MQFRYLLRCPRVFWCVLAIALASFCVCVWAQSWEETSLSSVRFLSDSPPAPADFDADRIVDPLIVDRTGWPLSVEIQLSRTQAVSVLSFDHSLSMSGSLTARDLDHDGDIDLLWKGALSWAPPTVNVWVNDGTGRFTLLLSFQSAQHQPTPGRSFRKAASRERVHRIILSSERSSSPGSLSTTDRGRQGSASEQRKPLVLGSYALILKRHPSDRGPPVFL